MKRGLQLGGFCALLLMFVVSGALGAEPPAGTSIDNRAEASYEYASGTATADSNVVHVIAQALDGVALAENPVVFSVPGLTVPLPYLLTNTGNTTATYTITVAPASGDFTLQNLFIFIDTNHNGVIDPGDTQLANGSTITLPMGASANLLVSATVPSSATAGQAGKIRITATSAAQAATASNSGTVVVALPNVNIVKSASNMTPKPSDTVMFTLNVTNSGSVEADGVPVIIDGASVLRLIVRDVIPANTSFAAFVTTTGATPLYHHLGDAQNTYASAAPGDVGTVDAVAFALPTIAPSATYTFSFNAKISANASGEIDNVAYAYFAGGSGGMPNSSQSNIVKLSAPQVPPTISYYTNNTYNAPAVVSRVDWPLFLQAAAATCNLDPTTAESKQVTLTSKLTGDVETFTATETGPNTGLFRILPNVPTRDARVNPVVAGNGTLEVLPNDLVTAQLTGCGATSVAATIMIDPGGVVFDSRSNQPLAGAVVVLVDVTGAGNGGKAGMPATVYQPDGTTSAPSSVTTGSDGRFQFPLVLPSTYKLTVTPPNAYKFPSTVPQAQLPSGHTVDAMGSYGGNFTIQGEAPITIDVPLDPGAAAGLFVEKTASRTVAEIGDFIDYTVDVKNNSPSALTGVTVQDRLPVGFAYQLHSVRISGMTPADPQGGQGPVLTFAVGDLQPNTTVTLTYRVKIGPGARLGDGTNRAQAFSGATQSNTATARVQLQGGAFDTRGFIVGKVFADCNGNGVQDEGERGLPGVRVYLEDGTYVISDDFGQYSFYGVTARTHVLKLDQYTLPAGAVLETLSTRNAGDAGSQFITLHFGELFRADFAVNGCSKALMAAIDSRQSKNVNIETERALKENFQPEYAAKTAAEIKGLPATGVIGATGPSAAAPANASAPAKQDSALAADAATSSGTKASTPSPESSPDAGPAAKAPSGVEPATGSVAAAAAPADESADLDNTLGFVGLKNGDVLPFAQTRVTVKGPEGANFLLTVNGEEISQKKVGRKSGGGDKHVDVWEYVGIDLKPGENKIVAKALDPWGNAHGEAALTVVAPNKLGKLRIEIPKQAVADGKTPVKVVVRLTDAVGVPVMVRTPVTLDTSAGKWMVKDLDPNDPGTQVFIENGVGEFMLAPPGEPGSVQLMASSGGVKTSAQLDLVPELRPMLAAGVIELGADLGTGHAQSAGNAFTEALTSMSTSNADGSLQFGTRAAMLAKGRIPGDNLLTFAYDSDKSQSQGLFRDIQPDQYFPIYGDAGTRGFDAQSTSKMYLRLDHGKSYALYGDFMTAEASNTQALSLGNYSRSLTGVKSHWENSQLSVTAFTTRDSLQQVVVEIPANGTSGPYSLQYANGVENSEKVEILVRDRNQLTSVLSSTPLTRFTDYEFEPITGNLLFKAPIQMFDQDMNPQSIRVTYEVDQGGMKFWVGGANGQFKVNERLQFGGSMVIDQNPEDQNKLFSLNTTLKLAEKTKVVAEAAQTEHELTGNGIGYRLELNHEGQSLQSKLYWGRTQANFNNPVAFLNSGRGESGAKISYKLDGHTRLIGEFLNSEDVKQNTSQAAAFAGLERMFQGNIQAQVGFRYGHQNQSALTAATTATVATTTATSSAATPAPGTTDALTAKVSMPVPHLEKASVTGEYEQDVTTSAKMAAVSASYKVLEGGKVYARHEFISSLGDMSTLNSTQQRNTTVFGVETTYAKLAGTHLFTEYRDRNELDNQQTEAAVGLRNRFTLRPGLTATTGLESVKTLDGKQNNNSLAVTSGLEYSGSSRWRGSARMEWRGSATTDSILNTLGFAARINDDWTSLARNVLAVTTNKGASSGRKMQDRFQFGFAYRDTVRNKWTALSMIELKLDSDDTQPLATVKQQTLVFTTVANRQINRILTISGRYADKYAIDNSNGLNSHGFVQEVGTRVTGQLGKKWEVSESFSTLLSNGISSRSYSIGGEVGYVLLKNLSLATGFNVLGFSDKDLSADEVTRRGPYIRLRFKFDENLFKGKGEGKH